MKLAMKHMLMDLLTLIVAHQATRRAERTASPLVGRVVSRVIRWRPIAFAMWPKQREW